MSNNAFPTQLNDYKCLRGLTNPCATTIPIYFSDGTTTTRIFKHYQGGRNLSFFLGAPKADLAVSVSLLSSSHSLAGEPVPMPRDSLELVEQHVALLKKRAKSKKRTRLRSRDLDDWKSDRVYPQDKPASYNPMSLGRDVLCGGYRRSEYQIQVHSRDYAKRVVSRRESHEVKEGEDDDDDSHVVKVEKQRRPRSGKGGHLLPHKLSSPSPSGTTARNTADSKVDQKPPSNPTAESRKESREWSITTTDEVSDLIVRFSTLRSKQRVLQ